MKSKALYYTIPYWDGNPSGLLHGMSEPWRPFKRGDGYQTTLCGRRVLPWWRAGLVGQARVCFHCYIIIDYLKLVAVPPPPLMPPHPQQLSFAVPPRPDLCP